MFLSCPCVISIENTTLCAANCIMCVREQYTRGITCMTQELFEKCVDESVQCGVKMINICGLGDPLMDPELEQKLAYIKNNYENISVVLSTTGYRMNGKLLDIVCDYVDEMNISMYGIHKETYERVHGGILKYEENKKNIDELLSRKKRPYVIMALLDMPETHGEIEEWKSYYSGRADQINIWQLHRWPHSGNTDMTFKKKKPCRCYRLDTLEACYIKVDGEISPCCFDFNTELSIGNITKSSLTEILNGLRVQELRDMQEKDCLRDSKLICGDCDQLYSREGALEYSTNEEVGIGQNMFYQVLTQENAD